MLKFEIDDRSVVRELEKAAGDQWPYALALALTRTAQRAQEAVQAQTRSTFKLHGEFIPKGIRVTPARKADVQRGKAEAAVYTAPGISGWMPLHESGGLKEPSAHSGGGDKGRTLAIPGKGLTSMSYQTGTGAIRKRLKPAALLEFYNANKPGASQKGKPKTGRGSRRPAFIIKDNSSGNPLIVRRAAGKNSPLEVLYNLIPKAHLKPQWQFEKTVQKSVHTHFIKELRKAVQEALATAT